MILLAKTFMHYFLGANIGVMRFFWRCIPAEGDTFTVDSYASIVASRNLNHTKKSIPVVSVASFKVLGVYLSSYLSKVANSIVASITIDVVNVKFRPFSIVKKPRQSMRSYYPPTYGKQYIPILFPSEFFPIPLFSCISDAVKFSIFRVIFCMESPVYMFKHGYPFLYDTGNISPNGRV